MATAHLAPLLRHIHKLAAARSLPERSDRQLLDDFAARRDEAAFTILVARHGPMVLRVCRRVLHHEHDAEDAFQATFLVLARSTASIRKREALAGWLHGVAYRTAMKAKRTAARRRNHEARLRDRRTDLKSVPPTWDEVQAALDEEIQGLPEHYRTALVLCVLEGKSVPAAAAELGCKQGTMSSWLTRARRRLQQRLARRGIKLAALLVAISIAESACKAAVPTALANATIRFGLLVAAGGPAAGVIPSHVAALAAGVTRAMFLTKAKIAIAMLLAAGLFATGAGVATHHALAAKETPPAAKKSESPAKEAAKPQAVRAQPTAVDDKDSVVYSGRVLDPEGKPVAGAKLYLLSDDGKDKAAAKMQATTDQDGRFRFEAARDQAPLIAVADGYGPAWVDDLRKPEELTLKLVKDDVPIASRIVDLQGKPVAGATIRVRALKAPHTGKLDDWLEAAKVRKDGMALEYEYLPRLWQPGLAQLFPPLKTDTEGRFRLTGIGRERVVAMIVEGPTLETVEINIATRAEMAPLTLPLFSEYPNTGQLKYYAATFSYPANPCRPIIGVVRDKATGKPLVDAVVRAETAVGNPPYWPQTTTDKEGRYRLTGLAKGRDGQPSVVLALSPQGQPYLGMKKPAEGGTGLDPITLDFELKQGVWLQGRVTDKATGQGVESLLIYAIFKDALEKEEAERLSLPVLSLENRTDKQGYYRLVAFPGRAIIGARAFGASEGHYSVAVGAEQIKGGFNDFPNVLSFATYPRNACSRDVDTIREVNPPLGEASVTCNLVLDPGRKLTVRVEGPDGNPLDGVRVFGQVTRDPWSQEGQGGTLPVHGLKEGESRTLLFRHDEKDLAGTHRIKATDAGQVVVRLQPAAAVRGRLLDDVGRPWRHAEITVRFFLKDRPGWIMDHFRLKVRTDADGKFRIDGLSPGVNYEGGVISSLLKPPRGVFTHLRLASGEMKDLGDVTPKKNDNSD